jgi:peptide/nickel transport system permease protein
MLLLVLVVTLFAPLIAPYDPREVYVGGTLQSPSLDHPFGTDMLGRDQLSRVVYGGRTALLIAGVVLTVTVAIGTVIGCLGGYFGGRIDDGVTLLLNIVLALPGLSLTIAIVAILGTGQTSLLIALSATSWAWFARVFRGSVFSVRESLYVEAAAAQGATHTRIILRHILPNVVRPILALASLRVSGVILAVAALSFLGLGVQPPTPDWGVMLNDARPHMRTSPHLILLPSLCILMVSLGTNLLADALLSRGAHCERYS